jgi:hypothetical protein
VSGGLLLRWMRCIKWVVGQIDEMYQVGCCSGGSDIFQVGCCSGG